MINSPNKLPGICTWYPGTRVIKIFIHAKMKAGERPPAKTQNGAFLPNDLTKHMNLHNIFYVSRYDGTAAKLVSGKSFVPVNL